jgi:CHASE3 domain sensor protein
MPSQRLILGTGLAILLAISAASIGLDVKSRSDAASVDHTLGVLKKFTETRLLIRRAESAARGFAFSANAAFVGEFNDTERRIAPAFAELIEEVRDNPDQRQLLKLIEQLVARRLDVSRELLRSKTADDAAGIATLIASLPGRTVMEAIDANFDKLVADEEKLLALRSADSRRTGIILLAIDLAGALLILMFAAMLIREARRTNLTLETSLRATRAANESLEAAVAERTGNLVAAHEELRHSASVLQSTFNSMAEAVLVIDATGAVLLSNATAERLLRHRPGMNVAQLRALSVAYQVDGSTPIPVSEMPAARALRGEQFDGMEFIAVPPAAAIPFISWSAAGRCITPPARSAGRHWSTMTSPHRSKPSASCSRRRSWMRSENSPAAWRMISTTCSRSSPAPRKRWSRACRTSLRC